MPWMRAKVDGNAASGSLRSLIAEDLRRFLTLLTLGQRLAELLGDLLTGDVSGQRQRVDPEDAHVSGTDHSVQRTRTEHRQIDTKCLRLHLPRPFAIALRQ